MLGTDFFVHTTSYNFLRSILQDDSTGGLHPGGGAGLKNVKGKGKGGTRVQIHAGPYLNGDPRRRGGMARADGTVDVEIVSDLIKMLKDGYEIWMSVQGVLLTERPIPLKYFKRIVSLSTGLQIWKNVPISLHLRVNSGAQQSAPKADPLRTGSSGKGSSVSQLSEPRDPMVCPCCNGVWRPYTRYCLNPRCCEPMSIDAIDNEFRRIANWEQRELCARRKYGIDLDAWGTVHGGEGHSWEDEAHISRVNVRPEYKSDFTPAAAGITLLGGQLSQQSESWPDPNRAERSTSVKSDPLRTGYYSTKIRIAKEDSASGRTWPSYIARYDQDPTFRYRMQQAGLPRVLRSVARTSDGAAGPEYGRPLEIEYIKANGLTEDETYVGYILLRPQRNALNYALGIPVAQQSATGSPPTC